MLAVAHLISACDVSSNSGQSKKHASSANPENPVSIEIMTGTEAVSPEALFDFLHVAIRFEFWNCASSDNTENTYIVLDIKDDNIDEGFNPLLLMGRLRDAQLEGDPRALNEEDKNNDAELKIVPVSFAATGSDSISMTLHASHNYTSSVEDTVVYLTDVRTGPGRAFTAEDQINHIRLSCTANNVSADVMH